METSVGTSVAVQSALRILPQTARRRAVAPLALLAALALMVSGCATTESEDQLKARALDDALAVCKAAVRANPDDAQCRYYLGCAYAEKGLLDKAVVQFTEAIRLDPKHADAYYQLGLVCHDMGLLDEAILQHEKAAQLKPEDADVHYNLGVLYEKKQMPAKAADEFQRYLTCAPQAEDAAKV
ncbi:MAG: tetratricopeptide repeat protein, partial [Planctomycetes bacterium]|nr:tetratricopeptide repeat protein [Planctomycetota bacterium]